MRGYKFCIDFFTCIDSNSICPRGLEYNYKTGCPSSGGCNTGFRGISYLGMDDTWPVGAAPAEGSMNIDVPINMPCYVQLINNKQTRMEIKLEATDSVRASIMTLDFPFNTSKFEDMTLNSPYRINTVDQMTFIYLGSVVNQNTTSRLMWKKVPDFGMKQIESFLSICVLFGMIGLSYI